MAYTPTITQNQRNLNTFYMRKARVEFYYQFTSTCLRSHTIPRGLTINVHPCVPKSPCWEPAARLKKNGYIIGRAANWFSPALKIYHRNCAHHLRLQATSLESSIAAQQGESSAERSTNIAKTSMQNLITIYMNDGIKNFKLLLSDSGAKIIQYQKQKRCRRQFLRRETRSKRTRSDLEAPLPWWTSL